MADFTDDFSTYAVSKLPTFRDNFNDSTQTLADARWITTDTTKMRVDPVNEKLEIDAFMDGTNDTIHFDLGFIASDNWVLRGKITFLTVNAGSAGSGIYFGLSSDKDSNASTLQDNIYLGYLHAGSVQRWGVTMGSPSNLPTDFSGIEEVLPFTQLFWELKREGNVITGQIFNNSDFTDSRGIRIATTVSAGTGFPENLRFIKFYNRFTDSQTNRVTYEVDDIEFWDERLTPTFQDDFVLKPVTFSDDFSVDNWTTSNATFVNVSGGVNNFSIPTTTIVNDATIIDLGANSISDDSWVMRFKFDLTTFNNNSDPTAQELHIGISDSDETVIAQDVQDFIGFSVQSAGSTNTYDTVGADGIAPSGGSANVSTFTRIPSVEIIFMEIIRISATEITIKQYSDATFTTLLESSGGTISAGITGLRFIKIMVKDSDGTGNGDIIGAIDDLEFYNGTSTLTGWISTGLGYGVSTGTEVLNGSLQLNGADNHISFDLQPILGTTVDDERWVLRFRVKILSLVAGSSTGFTFAITDVEAGGGLGIIQDSVSGAFDLFPSIPVQGYGLGNTSGDDAPLPIQVFPASKIAVSISTDGSTDNFVELKRLSSTQVSMRVFTDAGYTIPLAGLSQRTIVSTIQNLRFIKFFEREINQSGSMTFEVDDIEFYNGITIVPKRLGGQQGDITFQDDFLLKPVTFSDDFTTDNFTNMAGTKVLVNTGTEVMDWSSSVSAIYNEGEFVDLLGEPINTDNWVLRCKLNINTAVPGTDTTGNDMYIGLSDNNTSLPNVAQDYVGWRWSHNNPSGVIRGTLTADNQIIESSPGGSGTIFTTSITTGTFYLTLVRSGINLTATIYSDANFTTIIEAHTEPIDVGIINLRYLKIMVGNFDGSGDSTFDGTIDDIQFYNGNSTLTDWISAVSLDSPTLPTVAINTTTKALEFDWINHNLSDTIYHDLLNDGITVSETDWTLRCKVTFSDVGEETINVFPIGLYDSNAQDSFTAQDFVYIFMNNTLHMRFGDGVILTGGVASALLTFPTVGVPVFWEIKRIGGTTLRFTQFSDSKYTEIIDSADITGVPSTLTGLRFIKCTNRNDFTPGRVAGIFEDIEFYNGVSVPRTPIEEVKDHEDTFITDNFTNIFGTKVNVNTGTQVIDWTSTGTGHEGQFNDILGKTINTDRWTLRCKLVINTANVNTDTTANDLYIGLSNNTALPNAVQDYIGWRYSLNNPDGAIRTLGELSNDSIINGNPGGGGVIYATPVTTGTVYLETSRNGSKVTGTIYSDPDFTQVIEAVTTPIDVGITGLRFLKVMVSNRDGTANHTYDGIIDDIQFWDGQGAKDHENKWRKIDL